MPSAAVTSLRRSDLKQEIDRPTGSTLLRYVGTRLRFTDEMYGYPDGTFFAVALDEVPVPPELAVAADKCGVDASTVVSVATVRQAVLDVLVAEALINAPDLLSDLTPDKSYWPDWELRELERKHTIAVSRLVRVTKLAEHEIAAQGHQVRYDPGPLPFAVMPPPPPVFPADAPTRDDLPRIVPTTEPAPPEDEVSLVVPPEPQLPEPEADESALPGSQVAERVMGAVRAARESELAQRLPSGVRRRLRNFERGAYVAQGDVLDPRADLAHAMADAQGMSKRRGEAAVIDWDGEWPVVVRRYGPNGCTIYRVEDALKRAGVADV